MHIAVRNDLDQDQERILLSACDKAWRRVTQVVVALTPVQHVHARSVVRAHLLGLVCHGERNEDRLASSGRFFDLRTPGLSRLRIRSGTPFAKGRRSNRFLTCLSVKAVPLALGRKRVGSPID